jgi:hypothetical protein
MNQIDFLRCARIILRKFKSVELLKIRAAKIQLIFEESESNFFSWKKLMLSLNMKLPFIQ